MMAIRLLAIREQSHRFGTQVSLTPGRSREAPTTRKWAKVTARGRNGVSTQ